MNKSWCYHRFGKKKCACEIYTVASHNLQFFITDFWES